MATLKEKPIKRGLITSIANFYKSNTRKSNSHLKPKPELVSITDSSNTPMSQIQLQKFDTFQEMGGGRREGGGGGVVALEGGRKSVSHVETNVRSVAGFLQVKVLVSDMPGFMQAHAFRCARTSYGSSENFSSKHMAYNIKKEFDKVYGPAWHCIVGSGFGSYVTHSTGCFLYFSIEKLYILVFKTKVQKALLP